MYIHTYTYIYIYIERERDRERERDLLFTLLVPAFVLYVVLLCVFACLVPLFG